MLALVEASLSLDSVSWSGTRLIGHCVVSVICELPVLVETVVYVHLSRVCI